MKTLPIHQVIPEIKSKLTNHNTLVLQAPPGAGKTTVVPLALMDESWLASRQIIMLEPRRLAVRASAARMAEMLGERVGERVGYQVKLDSVYSDQTRILIVTEGILTRKLQADPSLEGVGLVIWDEFHERSLHADLSLALALESQEILREDLRLLVMSATLDMEALPQMLDAPLVQSEGRAFRVERHYLYAGIPAPTRRNMPEYVYRRVRQSLEEQTGNILVFLAGVREIKTLQKLLEAESIADTYISALYGNLSKEEQDRAIQAPPKGKRKVVLATNIAQTSLTIDGIKVVIDSGVENISIFNPFSGMNSLKRQQISADSATQRAGRAGRVSAGVAYHMWHRSKILDTHDKPEILRADLTQLSLELALWGCSDIASMRWLDTPSATAVTHAKELLLRLGAIDSSGAITHEGRAMSRYGLHPRLSHMMSRARKLDLGYEASLLASMLTEKDIYLQSRGLADMKDRVNVLHEVANGSISNRQNINIKQCRYILTSAKSIESHTKRAIDTKMLGVLLAFAYPERIAQVRHERSGTYLLSSGKGAKLYHDESLAHAKYIVIAELDASSRVATIYKAIEITLEQIERYLPHLISIRDELEWNSEQCRVEARHVSRIGSIVLSQKAIKHANGDEVVELLLEEIAELGLEVLCMGKEAMSLRARVEFVRSHGVELPDMSDEYLMSHMDEWLAPYCDGVSSLARVQALDMYAVLSARLSYEQSKIVQKLAPKALKVPSGSIRGIDYAQNPPVLAVRLQEMFGIATTPAVMNGKVKLMLHLLSPAHRPMQVTQDLASFWANTYDEVKKELRGKYKKHYWPDNPLEAKATARVKKNSII